MADDEVCGHPDRIRGQVVHAFVKLGDEYFTGTQRKSGLQSFEWQTGVLKHVELDWAAGIFITSPRSVSGLQHSEAR